ncbi:rab GTPase-activating protein 22-like isoform X2 [Impatiens glandulifera]|uniref:rab GTPase-activating protein 22-like isoform X2 n=1 Tax=Impatiens glandulifera TaxID=253017 RepID=UPI001FB0B636|nr:rab GTPase-activating protein 22-like isoform X2 [Impatiens glandulifera]
MRALRRSHTSSSSSSSSSSSNNHSSSSPWIPLKSVLLVVASSSSASSIFSSSSDRGNFKSPWSRRKRKHPLTPEQWKNFFTSDGKLRDGGAKFFKKVRSAGVDPTIRAEVWPFLLGVYNLNSTSEEREVLRNQKRKEYEKLRTQCRKLLKGNAEFPELKGTQLGEMNFYDNTENAVSNEKMEGEESGSENSSCLEDPPKYDSSDSELSSNAPLAENIDDETSSSFNDHKTEDFSTWQRIIRLDAIRANDEWISYSPPAKLDISYENANHLANQVGLKDYNHLEPYRIIHASRLVAILEAYALFDPEIGYCQGMSDLLSPLTAIISDDHEAFWCFVGFMKKARHNFRLDEMGIRRQLNMVSKIIKFKDSHLYRHLEMLQAGDCFFVYRMVVVLFRRELTFEQTVCLWELMWADQAAIRSGIGKSAWSMIRLRAPPTDDLLLYAIAASVLQRRKLIIEKYSSMDEILRECNSMAGQLDVWKLLDGAHDLVMNLHEKIETISV